MMHWVTKRQRWLIAVYLVAVTVLLFRGFVHWAYDDPFITYRYARNILLGNGFVYNPGLKVLSTTTPLFALLLSGIGFIVPDIPLAANFLGVAGIALGAYFIWDLSQTWYAPWAGWVALLLYPWFPLLASTLGSETTLYIAVCLGSIAMYARRKFPVAAILAGLAVLLRADAILVAGLLAGDYLLRNVITGNRTTREKRFEKFPWGSAIGFLLILLAWHGFAWYYFGSPLPVTLSAKQAQGMMAISQRFAPGLVRVIHWYGPVWYHWIEAFLAILGVLYACLIDRRWLLLLGWTVLYFAAYTILGVSSYFWYYAPLVPGFVAAIGLGFQMLWRLSGKLRDSEHSLRWISVPILALGLLGVTIAIAQAVQLRGTRAHPDRRYRIYRAAGEWIAGNTSQDATVGALEVGIIGYFAQRPMIDFAGLIQPEVAHQMRTETTYQDTARWAIEHYHPDYLVWFQGVFPELEKTLAAEHCREVVTFVKKTYDAPASLVILMCSWNP